MPPGGVISVSAALVVLITALSLSVPGTASAARPAFQVNDANDRVDANLGDGLCRTSAGTCTLRAAIQQANMLNGADAIDLPGGVYTIRLGGGQVVDPPDPPGGGVGFVWDPGLFQDYEGDFDIGGPLTINGAGDASTIVDGGAPAFGSNPEQTALDRVFEIHPNAGNVTISGVTIREGWAEDAGGGVMNYSAGVVRLVDSTVRDNLAWNYGGGIYSGGPEDGLCVNACPIGDGRLEIVRTNLTGNRTEGKGGGIFSTMSSTAVIGSAANKSTFTGNHADEGAAIYNGGEQSPTGSRARVEVSHGRFDDNLALADGGALYNEHEGDMAVSDSTFTNNLAWGEGGAFDSGSKTSASIARSTFTENRAGGEGGAVKTHGERPVSITDSTFTGNRAGEDLIDELGEFHEGEGGGGGAFVDGTGGVVILRSRFVDNHAQGDGGGAALEANGTVLVSDTEFSDNETEMSGGGVINGGMRVTFRRLLVSGNKALEEGGGIDNQGSDEFVVENSTIMRNTAFDGGGIANRPDALSRIVNTTLWDNRAKNWGGGFDHESDADTEIVNTTFSGNIALVSGGGIFVDADGGLRVMNSTITQNLSPAGSGVGKPIESINFPIVPSLGAIFRNTIVAGNRLSTDCNGAWASEGGNLDGGDQCYFMGVRDRTGVDPQLDALADNGGPVMTHMPRLGSFAIDGGVDAVYRLEDGSPDRCPDFDARGIARPQNGRCDSGAQEFDGPFGPPDSSPPQTTVAEDNPTQTGEFAKFRFSGTDNLTPDHELSFECRILNQDATEPPEPVDPTEPIDPLDDEFRWYGCSNGWPGDALQIEDGPNKLEVRAIDRNGNVDPTPDVHNFIGGEDITPPQTFLTAKPANPSTRNTAVFGFSATDDSTDPSLIEYECRIDFGDWEAVECLNPMSFSNLTIGQHTFHVRAVDEGDNVDPSPATYTWDVTSPTNCDGANVTVGASGDTYVDEGSPIENFGISEELLVRSSTVGPPIEGDRARLLVDFVLPNAIPGCRLTSARLRLFSESEPGRKLEAVPIAQSWSEMQATWNNQPATSGTPAVTDAGSGYREWNVTEQVEAMMASGGGHGFMVRDAVENDFEGAEQGFSSRDTIAEPPEVPKLVLRFAGGTPTPSPPPPSENLTPRHVECGDVITESTRVLNDLSCELGDALTIAANDLVLDLGGHTIDGPDYLLLGEEENLAAGVRNIGHENVVIRNGTVQEFGAGVSVMAGGRWGRIENLTLHKNALAGVELFDADDGRNGNVVRNNTFTMNETGVSVLGSTENNVIEENTFDGNIGVAIWMVDSSDNRIERNEISGVPIDPNFDSDGGMLLEGSTDNVIVGNRTTESGDAGVILAMGSHRNRVENNILSLNGDAGIAVEDSDGNELVNNTAHLSSDAGIVLNSANNGVVLDNDVRFNPTGVDLAGSSGNVIEGNDADGNEGTGIEIGSGSLRNRVIDNEASGTQADGIVVQGDALDPITGRPLDGNLVEGNQASGNQSDGIVVAAGHTVRNNSAHHNLGWGIHGEEGLSGDSGTVDGGGNTASGNGEPEQCAGVRCTPGTAPPLAQGPDLAAPDTQVTHAPEDGASSMTPQVIRFTGTDNVAPATALRYECRMDPPPDPVIPPEPPEPPEPGEPPEPPEPVGEFWEECASPIRIQYMLTGEHRFEVRAIDPSDNVDFTPAVHEWTVSATPPGPDSTPPQTTISDGPSNPSTSRNATFRFRASDNSTPGPDLTYECRLDDAAYQPCANPKSYENLPLGEHTFRVRALDVQGNPDLSPATRTWTVQPEPPDNNPPETSIDKGPDPRTVQTGATFEFSSDEEGATYECSLDTGAYGSCASPRELTGLAVGEHTFRVKATDRAGNPDDTPATLTWAVAPAPVPRTVACGQTITQSIVVQNDLADCGEGLIVGAHGITIDLDGRTLDGNGGGAGIRNNGFDHVTITGDGKLQEFEHGIQLNAGTVGNIVSVVTVERNKGAGVQLNNADDGVNGNTIRQALVTGNELAGIWVAGGTQNAKLIDNNVGANAKLGIHIAGSHGTLIERNRITASSEAGVLMEGATNNVVLDNVLTGNSGEPVAVTLASNDNRVEGNLIQANSKGVHFLQSNGNDLIDNEVVETGDQGIMLEQSNDSVLRGNLVRMNSGGIDVYQSSRNVVEENEVVENSGAGIWVDDQSYNNVVRLNQANSNDSGGIMVEVEAPSGSGTLVDRNTANGNDSNGIAVLKIGHTVVGNRTDNNMAWGIYATVATSLGMVVDGGGNRAVGNKELLQCFTIRCDGTTPPRETFPPETTVTQGPADSSPVDSASFAFDGSDNSLIDVRFECRLDDGAWQACASPQGYSNLSEGDHLFEVRAVDHAGNVDMSPARWEWTYTPLPPGVAPDTVIDSGPDAVTVDRSATFRFSSNEPGVTFECNLDNAGFGPCDPPKAYTGLSEGQHSFQVRARDGEGLTDGSPATMTWRIGAAPTPKTVSCGEVLTTSTLVTNSLTDCPADGLVAGAADITIDLNGNMIDGDGEGGGAGIRNSRFDNVTVTNGTVQEFEVGVQVDPSARNVVSEINAQLNVMAGIQLSGASDASVRTNTLTAGLGDGIALLGGTQRTLVRDNTVTANLGRGIFVENSSDNRIEQNSVSASEDVGISLERSRNNGLVRNDLSANVGGIEVQLLSHGTLVDRNTLSAGEGGINVGDSNGAQLIDNVVGQTTATAITLDTSNGAVLRRNDLRFNDGGIELSDSSGARIESNNASGTTGTGIAIDGASLNVVVTRNAAGSNGGAGMEITSNAPAGQGVLIDRNTAMSNGDDGILVEGDGHTIVANTAHLNGEWGIYSNGANVDGGGNLAAGNVEPPQCFGIVCDDGDFVPPGLPDTTILEKPADPTGSRRASFTFIGEDDTTLLENLEFQCRLDSSDDADWEDCENPQEYASVSPGRHTFEVRALDEAEFFDPTPARYSWTYERLPSGVAPDTQITLGPPSGPLFDAVFQFQSNEPDARFQCKLDSGPWQTCADDPEMVAANFFAFEHEFEDTEVGPHSFQVRAIDLENLVDPTPAVHNWTITGLLTTIIDGPAFEPGEGGDPPSGGETDSRTARFDFAANVPDATFECSLDMGPFVPCEAPVTYTGLAVGEHIFRITATDPEGEMVEMEPAEYEWEVIPGADDSPPETTITKRPAGGSSDTVFEFAGQDDQTGPNQLTFECRLDSTSDLDWYGCESPHNLLEEFPAEEFAPGPHVFEVRAVDDPETPSPTNPEGNPDPTPARYAWTSTADTTPPETTLVLAPPTPTIEPGIEIEFAGSDNATPLEEVAFECSIDDGPWEACSSPHALGDVEPGQHNVRIRAVDLALNADPTPLSFDWELIGPPETTIDAAPPFVTASPLATFEFSSDQANTTFMCSLNGGDLVPCTSPVTYDVGGGGEYSFEVYAINEHLMEDDSPALHEWTVDAGPDVTPPDTTVLTGPGLITTSIDAEFTFFASQFGSAFECQLDGEGFGDCTSPHLYTGLEAGVHVFEVRAVDPAENVDPTPAVYTWSIDGPPLVEITNDPGEEIESTSVTFEFVSSDEGSTFECWLDGTIVPCSSPYTWSGLALGEHIFAVRATDPAGHVGEWEDHEFTVLQGVPPQTLLSAGPFAETTSRDATFEFSSSEEGSTFECSLDEAAFAPCETPVALTGLSLGDHSFEVRAIDGFGHQDPSPAEFAWTVLGADQLETTITFGPPAETIEEEAAFAFNANAGDATFQCSLDGAAFEACGSPAEYSGVLAGEHVFRVRAVDAAGNVESTPAEREWTVVGPPVTTFTEAPSALTGDTDARFVFAADQANSTYMCSLNGAEPAPCTSPVEFTDVGGGNHTFEVEATNSFGLVEENPAIHEWTIDASLETTAPQTQITVAPPARTGSPDAVFEFTGTDNVTGSLELDFECSLNAAAYESCSSPHEVQDLEPGDYTMRVRAIDQAGNVDQSPATHAWTVEDVTAPETSIDSGPEDPTRETSATFEFSSDEAGATFQCSLDGGAFAACDSPHQLTGLALGDHSMDVRARDAAGNFDSTPERWTWTVEPPPDVTPPVTEILSGPATPTIETTATFALGANEAVDRFECSLDDGPYADCESPHELTSLSLGQHTLRVRATDLADNVDETPAVYTWTIVAPPPPPDTTLDSAPASPTADSSATFAFSSSTAGVSFQCALDGSEWQPCASPHFVGGLSEGSHRFEVRARRSFGVVDPTPAVHEWTVGLAPDTELTATPASPTVETGAIFEFTGSDDRTPLLDIDYECSLDGATFQSCSSPHEVQGLAPGAHEFRVRAKDWTNTVDPTPAAFMWTVGTPPDTTIDSGPELETESRDATFTFSADRAGTTFECALDQAEGHEQFAPCTSPVSYNGLELGEHLLLVRARDAAGTVDPAPAEYEWAIGHLTAPVTTIQSGPPAETTGTSATFEFTANEAGVSFQCSLDGGPFVFCDSPKTYHDLAPGEHVLEVQAVKPHLLASPEPGVHEWTVLDVTDPETTILTGPPASTPLTEAEFTFSSNEIEATFECSLDGAAFEECSSPADFSGLAAGPHELRVRAVDASGNSDATPAARSWTVVDVEPPDTDITAQPSSPTTSTSASFGFEGSDETTATGALRYQCRLDSTQQSAWVDNCTSPHTYTGLGTGTHRFDVRAIDQAGNPDPTPATHEWTIQPADTTPPNTTLAAGGPPFSFTASESGSTFECQVDTGAWAACTSPRSVTGLSAGSHTFRVRARDAAGNVDATPASRTWTVQAPDTTPPNTTLAAGGPPFSFTSSESNSTFECSLDGAAFAACTSPRAYTGLPPGSHEFRVRARDAAGNVDQTAASHTWTVAAPGACTASTVTLGAAADGWILQDSANQNYGNDSVLKLDSKNGANARSLVRFNLPTIPSGCQLTSAKLRLYAASYKTGRTLQALAVAAPWTEGALTWNNQPATTGAAATVASGSGYREWTVTTQVQSMYSIANHGFLIRDATENATGIDQGFHSREKGTDNPPRLVLSFG